jgi:hypothetical protein
MGIYIKQSDDILAADELHTLQEEFCSYGQVFTYQLTADEMVWLDFVRGRYSIADWIDSNSNGDLLTFNSAESMSKALDEDCQDAGKAVCLSDDTALQKLFFWLYVDYGQYDGNND